LNKQLLGVQVIGKTAPGECTAFALLERIRMTLTLHVSIFWVLNAIFDVGYVLIPVIGQLDSPTAGSRVERPSGSTTY